MNLVFVKNRETASHINEYRFIYVDVCVIMGWLSWASQPKCQNLLTMPIEIEMITEENILTVVWRKISTDPVE